MRRTFPGSHKVHFQQASNLLAELAKHPTISQAEREMLCDAINDALEVAGLTDLFHSTQRASSQEEGETHHLASQLT